MKTRLFMLLALVLIIPGLLTTTACSKKAVKSTDTGVGSGLTSSGGTKGSDKGKGSNDISGASPHAGEVTPTCSATQPNPNYAVVKTFFATDRNSTGKEAPDEKFGNGRSQSLTYGECEISIPCNTHEIGRLENPSILRTMWIGENAHDPAKDVLLLNTSIIEQFDFFKKINDSSQGGSVLLFVHGYNVTFRDAARRTAQIAYDLSFKGAPIFYSWPSQGGLKDYMADENSISWSHYNLKEFLKDFFKSSKAQNVFLIAHSMGNRGLTRALVSLKDDRDFQPYRHLLKEIILAAPDIDLGEFIRMSDDLKKMKCPITLYVSSNDVALNLSKKAHKYPRAGENVVVINGIETVDATDVDKTLLGHSYIAEVKEVILDLKSIIEDRLRANKRSGLSPKDIPQIGTYWKFGQ